MLATAKTVIPKGISSMLANYSLKGNIPEKFGDPRIPTIPCTIKRSYVKYDLHEGVSFMPFYLHKISILKN